METRWKNKVIAFKQSLMVINNTFMHYYINDSKLPQKLTFLTYEPRLNITFLF